MYRSEVEAREAVVTRRQARSEVEKHGHAWSEFVADVGDAAEYEGSVVLDWLGY